LVECGSSARILPPRSFSPTQYLAPVSSSRHLTISLGLGLARLVAEEEELPPPPLGEEPKPEEHHKPRPLPDLTVFPRVHLLIASSRSTPSTPAKTVVRTPVLRRPCRSRPHREGATGESAWLNSGEPPLVPPHALRWLPLSAAAQSEPPIPDWMMEI
jgi:hypothetical protein